MSCSPTNLDAAISLGEELINLFLKDFTGNQTGIAHIINFHADSLLHEAAGRGSVQQLQRLLQNRRSCVNVQRFISERDERGKTPLMWACLNNSVDVIKSLLSNGVDLYVYPLDKRRFSTLAEVKRARFSHFSRGGEHVFTISTTTANMVCIMWQGVTRAKYSSCCLENYKQVIILKTGKIDFQFITLRPKAVLNKSCFYFRTEAA